MNWIDFKAFIEHFTGLERDALHIYAALIIQCLAAFALRKSLSSLSPWTIVLFFALLNEWFDNGQVIDPDALSKAAFEESYKDIWNTMLAPTMLLLLSRFCPYILVRYDNKSGSQLKEPKG